MRVLILLLALWLAGCAAQTRSLVSQWPADLPPRVELESTPFHAQQDYQCGPAALAMSLGAAGIAAAPEQLAAQVFLPGRQGSLQIEMLAGARRHGAPATVIPGRVEALLRELAAGHAVVVLQNLGLSWAPSWHYAVAIGYDLAAREVLLRSGPMRRQRMALDTFEHTWTRAGSWAFVALPPGRLPVTADEAAVTEAAIAFERVAPAPAAQTHYAAALARWPDSLTLAIGLGNSAYAAGQLDQAAATFRTAAQRHADGAAWLNLATVLEQTGELDAARDAAARASAIAGPWQARARDMHARLLARQETTPSAAR